MKTKRAVEDEFTPGARLVEASLRRIIGYQLAQAAIVTSQIFGREVADAHELRPVEFTVLTLVDENPGVSARALAGALGVTPPNIAMWLDRLESRDLVERERSRTDRRAQHIRVTAKGAMLTRKAGRAVLAGEEATLSSLSHAERAMLAELLHKVALCRQRQ